MNNFAIYIILGLIVGIFSGIVGIGGGIILIPILVYIFGLSQHLAQGTTLAVLVPPVGLLAAWSYYNKGFVNIKMAVFIAIGMFIGGFFGARIANHLSNYILQKIFGITILLVGIKMVFFK